MTRNNELTKLQRATLEAAALRNDHADAAWPIREGKLNTGAATRVMKELIRKGLVIEKQAVAKAPVWREDGDGRRLAAVISEEGLAAIGMLPSGKAGRQSRAAGKKALVAAKRAAVAAVSQWSRGRSGNSIACVAF